MLDCCQTCFFFLVCFSPLLTMRKTAAGQLQPSSPPASLLELGVYKGAPWTENHPDRPRWLRQRAIPAVTAALLRLRSAAGDSVNSNAPQQQRERGWGRAASVGVEQHVLRGMPPSRSAALRVRCRSALFRWCRRWERCHRECP